MKAVILAGGTGSRLRPVTHTMPKQLVPIANKPVLEYVIEDLVNAGIEQIGIVLGNRFWEQIQTKFGDGGDYDVDMTYIVQGEPLGLAHAVGCAEQFVDDDPFLVYFGDTIIGNRVTERLVEAFDPTIHTVGLSLQHVDDPSRFGIADFDSAGNLRGLAEKPDDPPSPYAYIGVLALSSDFFEVITSLDPSWRGELELTQAVDRLIRTGVNTVTLKQEGIWKDVGTPDDVINANRALLQSIDSDIRGTVHPSAEVNSPVQLGEGSEIGADTTINGPVVVGQNTVVEAGGTIGPNVSIGDGCLVSTGSLRSSVIFDGVTIDADREFENMILAADTAIREDQQEFSSAVLGVDAQVMY